MQLVLFQESAFEVLHAGFEERLRFVAGDVLGNVGAASFCMAHLAQDSSIRAGDAFDGPGGTVRVEAAVVSRISFKVRVLGSNLAISGKSLDLFIGCDEAAFAVADSDAVEVARLAERKPRGLGGNDLGRYETGQVASDRVEYLSAA